MANRLHRARSFYLRQHADNPVDWYPWGPEAFAAARATDRPILLSIGYSSCHWCHVMERESFSDPAVAARLARDFIAIKVDREERPDIDGIYMRAVQALTGEGGWPLTVFLTPGGKPFHGGTYYPPEPRHGRPSFTQVLAAVAEAWKERRGAVEEGSQQLVDALARSARPLGTGEGDGAQLLRDAADRAMQDHDPVHGGFGGPPRFPQPPLLEFLLAAHRRFGEPGWLDAVVRTLLAMARGGIRDHLGGGFHRYAVDARWRVPHFEKMLHDNALLARVYLTAWQLTGIAELRDVACAVLDELLRDFRNDHGGFHSAVDADSEGEEGRFYLWSAAEVEAALAGAGFDADAVDLFRRVYGVHDTGAHGGRSILHPETRLATEAAREGRSPAELARTLAPMREALREARRARPHPFVDRKALCVWNAFTVRALAEASVVLGRRDYLEAARTGARFLRDRMHVGGRPMRVWVEGEAHGDAFLDDVAALGNALLTLHEVTLEPEWFEGALEAAEAVVRDFWSDDEGVFFDARHDAEALIVRPREILDLATPSGNSLAVELLLRVGHLAGRDDLGALAHRVLAAEAEGARRIPTALGRLLTQRVRVETPPLEVVITGPRDHPRARELVAAAWSAPHPNRTVTGEGIEVPLLEGRTSGGHRDEGPPVAWICRDYHCEAPTSAPEAASAAAAEEW